MKKIILVCAYCIIALKITPQTTDKKWNFGLHGGLMQYNGDLGDGFYNIDQAAYGFAGISVSRYLSKHFDASLFFTRGEFGYIQKNQPIIESSSPNSFLVRTNTTNLILRFYFTKPNTVLRPYIFAGAGVIWYEAVYSIQHQHFEFSVPTFGGGLNVKLGPVVSLNLQESFLYTSTDNIDYRNAGNNNDLILFHTAGLTFNLGKKHDEDKDGISDKNDKCPATPSGVLVDKFGCPVNGDGDGVADYLDKCPQVAGLTSLDGCPDKDMDGITDQDDRCPDVFGKGELNGCPDSDNDGIADMEDKCPGTTAGYKVNSTGCTFDNDKDGIVNEEDRCPDLAGPLSMKGCPDTDNDGVSDLTDLCPRVIGTIANKGCPEIAKEDIVRITLIASKIYFETNSAQLKLISNSQLDDLSGILKKYDGVNLSIEGHTDSDADDAYNLTLSQQRTESVRDYLIAKGIDMNRLSAVGYGETRPIADNKNAAGKAKNRRVELITAY